MASERRSSLGAASLTSARRASSSSFQLPPLPPSTESLASETSIPAPPPPASISPAPLPPPKDFAPMPMPITPQRKPVMRQKSPLSNEAYFESPASSMPGSFPATPPVTSPNAGMPPAQFSTTAYASTSPPSTNSKSPKRPSSMKNLFSFKGLRRSSNKTSPQSSEIRPASPGTESTFSSPQPSLNKKRSGTFWRRKSSLGMTFGKEGENEGSSANPVVGGETVKDEPSQLRSPTPGPGSEFPTIKKRKSGTFWRRRSSLGINAAMAGPEDTETEQSAYPNAASNGTPATSMNGGQNRVSSRDQGGLNNGQNAMNGKEDLDYVLEEQDEQKPLPDIGMLPARSWSPPPQLPDFVGGGGGLGEDLFKDIH